MAPAQNNQPFVATRGDVAAPKKDDTVDEDRSVASDNGSSSDDSDDESVDINLLPRAYPTLGILSARRFSNRSGSDSSLSSGSRATQRRTQLGTVVFKCPDTGMERRGRMLRDGFVWNHDEMYANLAEWMDGAALRPPLPSRQEIEESVHVLSELPARAIAPAAKAPGDAANTSTEDEAESVGAVPQRRGRGRSHSVRSPASPPRQSVLMLNTLDDDINERVRSVAGRSRRAKLHKEALQRSRAAADGAAARRLLGPLCGKVCKWRGTPTTLIADAVVRSCASDLRRSNRAAETWDAAFARAGGQLDVSCETLRAKQQLQQQQQQEQARPEEQEAAPQPLFAPGHVAVTPAFELPSTYMIHVVTAAHPEPLDALRAHYTAVLETARARGLRTVVLPLLGDEALGARAQLQSMHALLDLLVEQALVGAGEDGGAAAPLWGLDRLVIACETAEEMARLTQAMEDRADEMPVVGF